MFNRSPYNNSGNVVNTNTHFFNSYSETSLLRVGGWNQQLSIRLQPAIGKDSSGVTMYAQDQSQILSTSLTQDSAIVLYEGFKKEIEPCLDANIASKKISTQVSNGDTKKIISIYYDGNDAYLEVATSVNDQNITTDQNVITHKFNKRTYMVDYDFHTGGTSETRTVESEFLNFIDKVKKVKDLTPVVVHTMKYAEAIKNTFRNNNGNGGNNGFIPQSGGQANYGQNLNSGAPTLNYSQPMTAPSTNANSMDEFLPFV